MTNLSAENENIDRDLEKKTQKISKSVENSSRTIHLKSVPKSMTDRLLGSDLA